MSLPRPWTRRPGPHRCGISQPRTETCAAGQPSAGPEADQELGGRGWGLGGGGEGDIGGKRPEDSIITNGYILSEAPLPFTMARRCLKLPVCGGSILSESNRSLASDSMSSESHPTGFSFRTNAVSTARIINAPLQTPSESKRFEAVKKGWHDTSMAWVQVWPPVAALLLPFVFGKALTWERACLVPWSSTGGTMPGNGTRQLSRLGHVQTYRVFAGLASSAVPSFSAWQLSCLGHDMYRRIAYCVLAGLVSAAVPPQYVTPQLSITCP